MHFSKGIFGSFHSRLILPKAICLALFSVWSVNASGQDLSVANMRISDAPGALIVIFSPEVQSESRTAAQGVVWRKFIDRLRKRKVPTMEVVNEVATTEAADRARALELAAAERNRYTIWLQFASLADAAPPARTRVTLPDRLTLRYQIFAPGSDTVISQGEVEEQRAPQSQIQTGGEKIFRDNSGRIVNARPNVQLPNGSTTAGPAMMDIDALGKVGEEVADRFLNAVRKHGSAKMP